MISKYFKMKIQNKDFKENLENIVLSVKNAKVLLYGAGAGFLELNKRFKLIERTNPVAISDLKFENFNQKTFKNIPTVAPSKIKEIDFDTIIVTNEKADSIVNYLKNKLRIFDKEIKVIFDEDIQDAQDLYNYLEKFNFKKHLAKITKKYAGRKILIYGAGACFEVIKKYYDLSNLNIIAISDKKFKNHAYNEIFLGYPVCAPEEIVSRNPDYVLVATKMYANIIENLYYGYLKDTKIKIKPLIKKDLLTLIKEIWS